MAKIETSDEMAEFLWAANPKEVDYIAFWDALGVEKEPLASVVRAAMMALEGNGEDYEKRCAIVLSVLTSGARLALRADLET